MIRYVLVALIACCNLQQAFGQLKAKFPEPPIKQVQQGQIQTLNPEEWFVVESPDELLIFSVPENVVAISEETGPIKLKGKFAYGNGAVEVKTFAGPFVYTINRLADTSGACELLFISKKNPSKENTKRLRLTIPGPVKPVDPITPITPIAPIKPPTPELEVDTALMTKLRQSIIDDGMSKFEILQLATIYKDVQVKQNDKWGDVLEGIRIASLQSKIRQLPSLAKSRQIITDYIGKFDFASTLDKPLMDDVNKKFKLLSNTLQKMGE